MKTKQNIIDYFYELPEVKRLKELERILSNQLVELSNDISKYLSNKFLTKKGFI